MIVDPYFYLAATVAVLIVGMAKGGFGGGIAVVGVPLMAMVVSPFQAEVTRRASAPSEFTLDKVDDTTRHGTAPASGEPGSRLRRAAGAHHRGCALHERFGEIVYGRNDAILLGSDESDDEEAGPGENRYVFITAAFDETALPEPDVADTDAHASWEHRVSEGRQKAERLAARFARWYYVVAASSYDRIHKPREGFLNNLKEADAAGAQLLRNRSPRPPSPDSLPILDACQHAHAPSSMR